jgi:hypothetical protein
VVPYCNLSTTLRVCIDTLRKPTTYLITDAPYFKFQYHIITYQLSVHWHFAEAYNGTTTRFSMTIFLCIDTLQKLTTSQLCVLTSYGNLQWHNHKIHRDNIFWWVHSRCKIFCDNIDTLQILQASPQDSLWQYCGNCGSLQHLKLWYHTITYQCPVYWYLVEAYNDTTTRFSVTISLCIDTLWKPTTSHCRHPVIINFMY